MPRSAYDEIASEYYESGHITSRNFDNATRVALAKHPFDVPEGLVLEIGAGRGRVQEFLRVDGSRILQLDNSEVMFALEEREGSLLQIHADACRIPLVSQQFGTVVGFLVDPFMGLACLAEAYRMLIDGGRLLLTVPTRQWGTNLRERLEIDVMTTRFKILDTEKTVVMPSLLHSKERIEEMLALSGFREIVIYDHCLAEGEEPISPDITSVCEALHLDYFKLPVIHTIRAQR